MQYRVDSIIISRISLHIG